MELRQLQYFLAVAEAGTFTRAAEQVHVAQSGISAQIKALERELGQALFERGARTARLTAAGRALVPHAQAVLDAVAAGRAAVVALTGLLHGHVSVGAIQLSSTRGVDLPYLLSSFHHEHPGVDVSLVEDTAAVLMRRLREGQLDVLITSLTEAEPPGVCIRELHRETVVAAMLPSDPLAARTHVTLGQLSSRRLIALTEGSGLRRQLDRAVAQAGTRMRITFEAGHPGLLVTMAARGLGIALVPESALAHDDRVVGVRVPELPPGRIGIAWRDAGAADPATEMFIEHATRLTGGQLS
ncbi:LysR family transcriptional regulator [Nocardia sp. NPDC101769]|uniref:LysR family transcriptional regulator n=1 Tax=Nocardia sp. NPDC101769 TaxID=3364333 RepID=UPI003827A4B6